MVNQIDEVVNATTPKAMRLDFRSILATGKHSDFILECEDHIFKTHKAILCTASTFFKVAIEGNTKESDENKIRFPTDHPEILARLLVFVYTGQYLTSSAIRWKCDGAAPFANIRAIGDTKSEQSGKARITTGLWQDACLVALAMYQIADKTLIDDLKWASRSNFLSSFRPDRDKETEDRRFWAESEMDDVVSIISAAYDNTRSDDWMLHDPIVHRMLIGIQDYGCLRWEPYQRLLEDVPRLAVEIATSQLAAPRMGKKCKLEKARTTKGHDEDGLDPLDDSIPRQGRHYLADKQKVARSTPVMQDASIKQDEDSLDLALYAAMSSHSTTSRERTLTVG